MLSSLRATRFARNYSVKVTSFDSGKAVSEISFKARAGTRYETVPGASTLLAKYAFGNTSEKSALRLTREAELLGGSISATSDRQHITVTAKFLREHLPYFVSALASLAKGTLFKQYEYDETILPLAKLEKALETRDNETVALDAAHEVAFRNGLGNSLFISDNYVASNAQVKDFASQVYTEGNVKVYGKNVVAADFEELVKSAFVLPAGEQLQPAKTQFFSGEKRIEKSGLNTVVLSFPTERNSQLEAFKYLLSNKPAKWGSNSGILGDIPNVEIKAIQNAYHDASLLSIVITGENAAAVKAAAVQVGATLKKTAESGASADAEKRAVASAKVELADAEVNSHKIADAAIPQSLDSKAIAKAFVSGNKVLTVVGNTRALPYLDELL